MLKSYILLFVYITLCVIVGVLITVIAPSMCVSNRCYRKATLMSGDIDHSVVPCDNFYRHVCNNYRGIHVRNLALDKGSVKLDLEQIQVRRLTSFLERPSRKYEDRILRVLKMVYKTCMDKDAIEQQGYWPLLRHIEIALGFPLSEGTRWDNRPSGHAWSLDMVEFNTLFAGFIGGHLVNIHIHGLDETSRVKYVHVSQPETHGYNRSQRDAYSAYLTKVSSFLNSTDSTEKEQEINDLLDFRIEIEKITNNEKNCSGKIIEEDLKAFSKEFDFLGLELFLKQMLLYIPIPKHVLVTFSSRTYLTALKSLLEKTSNRTKSNYVMLHNIIEVTTFLPKNAREAYVNLIEAIGDENDVLEVKRKYLCVRAIRSKMSSALSALYLRYVVKQYRPSKVFENIMTRLKEKTKVVIQGLSWMDKATKAKAMEKIDAMELASPVPKDVFDKLTNVTAFRLYYEDLCFIGNLTSTLSAYLALQQFKTNKNWELLSRSEVVFDENIDIFSAKVRYDPNRNAVVVPMAYLRYPTFDRRWPFYLTFGGLASEIATEMIRGVDISGSYFNATGGLEPWWSSETRDKYIEYAGYFAKKYNAYLKEHIKDQVRDPSCMEEAMARAAGVKIAYLAYSTYERQRYFPERKLYGFSNYSAKQLFFMDFATFHCDEDATSYRDGESELKIAKLSPEYRVIGPLRNNRRFAKVFQCSRDDVMNPSEKCDIWGK